jgi:hypothetical protein
MADESSQCHGSGCRAGRVFSMRRLWSQRARMQFPDIPQMTTSNTDGLFISEIFR